MSEDMKTLRDELAMAALTGMLAGATGNVGSEMIPMVSDVAYKVADAMLAARTALSKATGEPQ